MAQMALDFGTLFFVLLGSKLLAGFVVVYLLISSDDRCTLCDAAMLPIQHPHGTHRLLRLMRLQRRWCMECGNSSLTRHRALPRAAAAARRRQPAVRSSQ